MGAKNALAALRLYGGKIPGNAQTALQYMALKTLDKDDPPEFWEGHAAIAESAFGAELIVEADGRRVLSRKDRKMVSRAIEPLFREGAITTTKHASGHGGNVKYRLWLAEPAPAEERTANENYKAAGSAPRKVKRDHTPESGAWDGEDHAPQTGASKGDHAPLSGTPRPGNRGGNEYEEELQQEESGGTQVPPVPLLDPVHPAPQGTPDLTPAVDGDQKFSGQLQTVATSRSVGGPGRNGDHPDPGEIRQQEEDQDQNQAVAHVLDLLARRGRWDDEPLAAEGQLTGTG